MGQNSNTGLTGLKPRCQQCCVPFWKFGGESFPSIPCIPQPPPSMSKASGIAFSGPSSLVPSLSDHSLETFSAFKDPCDSIGPAQYSPRYKVPSQWHSQVPLTMESKYSQFLGMSPSECGRGLVFLPHTWKRSRLQLLSAHPDHLQCELNWKF